MSEPEYEFLGIGALARRVGASPSAIRAWEAAGLLPMPARIAGSDRRVYRSVDVETIRARVEARLRTTRPKTRREAAGVAA